MNQQTARGLFLAAIAVAFGAGALRHPLGSFGHAGPGLFPLLLSGLLLALALVTLVQARLAAPLSLDFNLRNIVLIMLALIGFVALSKYVAMIAGIVFLVFVASLAGSAPSWKRSLKVAAALIVIAFLFQRLLGLNLNLL